MQQQPKIKRGIAALGAMTAAIKAQRALGAAGITVEVIALSPTQTRRGCAYGIAYPPALQSEVQHTLRRLRIPVSQYLED